MSESPHSGSEREISVPDQAGLDDTTLAANERALAPAAQPRVPQTGDKLGRYVVLRSLGTGGMGTVFEAYDAELDRHVALKLLRPGGGGEDLERRRRRLLREAQAMARLSHPNVIAVYDVGTFGDEVFIAMELVRGDDVRRWLTASRRGWREVLGLMVPAGRGLEAAHSASLVHRDFKPSNILISNVDEGPGRVKVLDFGLARAMHDPLSSTNEGEDSSGEKETQSALSATLTRIGDVVGTPLYMSPEQHSGGKADARSDQFAFCVSLYEALYGKRPFRGETFEEIAGAIITGRVAPEPAGRKVPSWLRAVCLRGLKPDPKERFGSMTELLRELDRHRRGALARVVVPIATMGIGAAGVAALMRDDADLCTRAEERLAGIWDDATRDEVREAIESAAPHLGPATATAVRSALDDYAAAWVAGHNEACAATRTRGEVSAAMMDRRMACLDSRQRRLRALVDLLREADAAVVQRAMRGVGSLPDVERCADLEALAAAVAPADDELASAVGALQMRLAEAKTQRIFGRVDAAVRDAEALVADAKALGYAPLLAEAYEAYGSALEEKGDYTAAEDALHEAIWIGEATRHDAVVADARTELAWVVAVGLGRDAELEALVRSAEAAAERAGQPEAMKPAIWNVRSTVLEARGKYAESLALRQKILALALDRRDVGDTNLPHAYHNVGSLQLMLGEYDAALQSFETASDLALEMIGPNHPVTAGFRQGVATAYIFLGRNEEAVREYEKVLAAREKSLGPEHEDTATTLNNLGAALAALDRNDEALQRYERALAIRRGIEGPEGLSVASTEHNVADMLSQTGRVDEALPLAEHALAIRRRELGDDHPKTAEVLRLVGRTLGKLERHAEAVKRLEEAVAVYDERVSPDHPQRLKAVADLERARAQLNGSL